MYDSPIIGCAECRENTCLMCRNLSPDCLRSWQLPVAEIAHHHAHISLADRTDFCAPHNLQSDPIPVKLPCSARGNMQVICSPQVLMRSFSQHMAVILYPVYMSYREGMADKASPFPAHTDPLGTEPIMARLLCICVSVQKQSFPTAISLILPRGLIVCLSN